MKQNFLVLLLLSLIGLLIHSASFRLSLYGDDWFFIYRFLTNSLPFAHINTALPGLLKYIAPYGPSIFLIGNEYKIFGLNYFFYYLVALIFRTIASFSLYLVCKRITRSILLSFLTASLFLVGFTGIQTTDWVFYCNIYLAVGFFFIGLIYQIGFYEDKQKKSLWFHFIFSLLAILTAPVRLYPLVFIIPLTDLFFLHRESFKKNIPIFYKLAFFGITIVTFWIIGVFGGPWGKIYSPGGWSVKDFTYSLATQPYSAFKSLFYWIGTIFIPDKLFNSPEQIFFVGLSFVIISSLIAIKCKERKWVILLTTTFLIFLLTMWFFNPVRLIGSEDRYLLPTFASGCLLIGILVKNLSDFSRSLKYLGYLILLILIISHAGVTIKTYNYWLSKGRDSEFINMTDRVIMADFKNPQEIIQPSKIYLDFDDTATLQSVQFGLSLKILVLSNTLSPKYFPEEFNDKVVLMNQVNKEGKEYIDSIFGYQYKNKVFKNITGEIREILRNN